MRRFRWVSLQLQNLCDPRRMRIEADVRQELGHLPKTLFDIYTVIYDQILHSGWHSRLIAERVLKWLCIGIRPLRPEELIAAVSVDGSGITTQITSFDVLKMTCNLVVLDKYSNAFRFAHLSVLEYLEMRPEYSEDETNLLAAERCLHIYLHAHEHSMWRAQGDTREYEKTFEQNMVLRDYGRIYWPAHASAIDPPFRSARLSPTLRRFLFEYNSKISIFDRWRADVKQISRTTSSALRYGISSSPTPFFAICNFGLTEMLQALDRNQILSSNYNLREMKSTYEARPVTPQQAGMNGFHMAINQGYDQTTEALLRVGVSPGQCTDRGLTSLQIATQQHHAHLIPLLIRGGADPNAKSVISPETTIKRPAYVGRPVSSIGFRTSRGVISVIDEDVEAPLHHAAFHGLRDCVTALLRMGADVNVQSSLGATPLHKALEGHKMGIVEILLESGANANAPLIYGRTPLHYAAALGQEQTARLLLSHGANPLAADHVGQTPYDIA